VLEIDINDIRIDDTIQHKRALKGFCLFFAAATHTQQHCGQREWARFDAAIAAAAAGDEGTIYKSCHVHLTS